MTTAETLSTMPSGAPSASLPFSGDTLLDLYSRMLRIRLVEERLAQVQSEGELPGPVHLYIGQEAVAVGVCAHLTDTDWIASTHRGHGHFLAKSRETPKLVAEVYGRATGVCGGKGGSMHVADISKGILGANGIVGGGIALATGAALTAKTRGSGAVSVGFFGDGAANQGVLMEALNVAALWKLPLILVCENNGFSEFSPSETVTAGEIWKRGTPMGIPSQPVDGNDIVAVYRAAGEAVERARRGDGASLLEMRTYRLRGHVEAEKTFLAKTYRTEEEVEARRAQEPLLRARSLLRDCGVNDASVAAMEARERAEVDAAFEYAASSPWPDAATAFQHMFA
ncbi:MAG TPA: thiamine pyrophosphate-dependent dehydrogenase E1 component subunit alpha [Burkholderiales bacterium]|nr:thiamine pyrophosphate-dependent dehydrogenase E1 component subunit alpha [Burkholderiales bacterium]